MEETVKKYRQRLRKVKDQMQRWEGLQSRFVTLFSDANSIIRNLHVVADKINYGSFEAVGGVQEALFRKHLDSLQTILWDINNKMEGFQLIVLSLERMVQEGGHLLKGGGSQLSTSRRVGIKPCLEDCLDALTILYQMHYSEYHLKSSVVSAHLKIAYKLSSTNDLGALSQLLADEPNIPRDEVQFIFDIIFSEEIC